MLNFKILQFHQVQIMMNYKTLFKLITKLKMKTTKKNSKTFLRISTCKPIFECFKLIHFL